MRDLVDDRTAVGIISLRDKHELLLPINSANDPPSASSYATAVRTNSVHLLLTSVPLCAVGSVLVCSAVGAHEQGSPWNTPDLPLHNKWPSYIDLIGASCNLASGFAGIVLAGYTIFMDTLPPALINRIVLVVLLSAWVPFLQNSFIYPIMYETFNYPTTGLQGAPPNEVSPTSVLY
jgi:hypothetical protein